MPNGKTAKNASRNSRRTAESERKATAIGSSVRDDQAATRGTDWGALRMMAEEDIERIAAEDTDNPATDESHWTQATLRLPVGKTSIHASFDRDVVEFFKRGGRGYQTRMNAVLRRHMEDQQDKKPER